MDRRKGIDRRKKEIEVYTDRREIIERRVFDHRSGFDRRIHQMKVSKEKRTYDRRLA